MVVPDSHLLDPVHLALMACTTLALAAYWALVRYGIAPLPTNRRLLVLRVFSAEQRGVIGRVGSSDDADKSGNEGRSSAPPP